MSNKANYVIGAPWPSGTSGICTYAYGSETHFGTLQEAHEMLDFIKSRIQSNEQFYSRRDTDPKIEDYQIYQLVPINSAGKQ